mgnify:CR=1 FL=1
MMIDAPEDPLKAARKPGANEAEGVKDEHAAAAEAPAATGEIGGPKGPEPTRYGDWEKKGRCIDF